MAKESGLGITSLTIDESGGTGRDITNDVLSFTFNTPQGVLDVTGLDKSNMERLAGLGDFQMQLTFAFNDASTATAWSVFKVRTGSRTVVLVHSAQTLTAECFVSDVSYSRGNDGSLIGSATLQLNNGTAAAWS